MTPVSAGRFTLPGGAEGVRQVTEGVQKHSPMNRYGLRVYPGISSLVGAGLPDDEGQRGVRVSVLRRPTDFSLEGEERLAAVLRLAGKDAGVQLLLLGGTDLFCGRDGHTYLQNAAVLRRWPERAWKTVAAGPATGLSLSELITFWQELARQAGAAPHDHQEEGLLSAAVWEEAAAQLQATLDAHAPLAASEREIIWKAGFLRGGTYQEMNRNGGATLYGDEKAPIWNAAHALYPVQRQERFEEAAMICAAQREEELKEEVA